MTNTPHTYPQRWPWKKRADPQEQAEAAQNSAPLDPDWQDEIEQYLTVPNYVGELTKEDKGEICDLDKEH